MAKNSFVAEVTFKLFFKRSKGLTLTLETNVKDLDHMILAVTFFCCIYFSYYIYLFIYLDILNRRSKIFDKITKTFVK